MMDPGYFGELENCPIFPQTRGGGASPVETYYLLLFVGGVPHSFPHSAAALAASAPAVT